MIKSEELKKYLDFAYSAYQEHNEIDNILRRESHIPPLLHPLWCASMLITDTQVPYEQRELGFKVLLLHDVLEDTSLELPKWVSPEVREAVQELTFDNFEQAVKEYPKKSSFIKLMFLYEKLASMYDSSVKEYHRSEWKEFILEAVDEIEKEYGNIRIVQIGKAIAENTDW